jgi:hypothetical protein
MWNGWPAREGDYLSCLRAFDARGCAAMAAFFERMAPAGKGRSVDLEFLISYETNDRGRIPRIEGALYVSAAVH